MAGRLVFPTQERAGSPRRDVRSGGWLAPATSKSRKHRFVRMFRGKCPEHQRPVGPFTGLCPTCLGRDLLRAGYVPKHLLTAEEIREAS